MVRRDFPLNPVEEFQAFHGIHVQPMFEGGRLNSHLELARVQDMLQRARLKARKQVRGPISDRSLYAVYGNQQKRSDLCFPFTLCSAAPVVVFVFPSEHFEKALQKGVQTLA